MTLSNRTKISISQFLGLPRLEVETLLEKHNIGVISTTSYGTGNGATQNKVKSAILKAGNEDLEYLLEEIVKTKTALKKSTTSATAFNERWRDLEKCLMLDGYKIENDKLITIEPNIDGVTAFEDELTHELRASGLSASQDIITLIEQSANNFKRDDFDGCLDKGRKALETLVEHIAIEKFQAKDDIEYKDALEELTKQGFLKKYQDKDREKELLKIVHYFISDGSHKFLRDEEYTRYSRNLTMSICYYVIKKYNYENRTNF